MIEDLQDAISELREYYPSKKELKEAIENNETYDAIAEAADAKVDIMYSDLLEWIKDMDKVYYAEEALGEFDIPRNSDGRPDFMRIIQLGQYRMNEELLNEALEELKEEYGLSDE